MSLAPAPPSMHVVMRDRCFQRTSSGAAQHRPYVATTEQMWALHDAMPEHLQPAILLGAFVGLRTAEVAGLRLAGVDLMGCIIRPAQQDNGEQLKTETSRTPLPVPPKLVLHFSAALARWRGDYITDGAGRQTSTWAIERACGWLDVRLEGELDGWSDGQHVVVSAGESLYLPAGGEHGFGVRSDTVQFLLLITPAGLERVLVSDGTPDDPDTPLPPVPGPLSPEAMERLVETLSTYGITITGPAPTA